MLREMAIRLWAMNARLGQISGLTQQAIMMRILQEDPDFFLHLGQVCDDMAIQLAKLSGARYDDCGKAVDEESFEPAYKFSR